MRFTKSARVFGSSVLLLLMFFTFKNVTGVDVEHASAKMRRDQYSTEDQRSEPPGQQELSSTEHNRALKPSRSPEEPDRPASVDISVSGDHLSIKVLDRPLKQILHEVSRKTGIPIVVSDETGGPPISIQFQDLPLDRGLQFLLNGYDSFFLYSSAEERPSGLKTLWVYPKGQGQNLAPVPAEQWASMLELEQGLTSTKAQERARAIEAVVDHQHGRALTMVLEAVKDSDDQVRYRTLFKALNSDLTLPSELLQDLVQGDPSPDVRSLALRAIAEQPGADSENVGSVAELALNDPSLPVQQLASEILDELETARRPEDSSLPLQNDGQLFQ